jgi:hypothetical protein
MQEPFFKAFIFSLCFCAFVGHFFKNRLVLFFCAPASLREIFIFSEPSASSAVNISLRLRDLAGDLLFFSASISEICGKYYFSPQLLFL